MVQKAVASVVATLTGIDAVIVPGAARPHFDLHVPMLNLPGMLGGEIAEIPAAAGYLSVPAGTASGLVPPRPRQLRVGMVWAGNPTHRNDRNRSVDLERFIGLCALPRVAWFSLQVGEAATQLHAAGAEALVHDLAPALTSYAETAEALAELDLVITVDTSVAHLAGAMGRPVWCLLPYAPDWRWQLGRRDTPWYSCGYSGSLRPATGMQCSPRCSESCATWRERPERRAQSARASGPNPPHSRRQVEVAKAISPPSASVMRDSR